MAQKAAASVGAGATVGEGRAVELGSVEAAGDGVGIAEALAVGVVGGALVLTELPQAVASRMLRRPTTSGRARVMHRMVAPTASMGR
jgi:hypothetical protein